MQKVRKYEGIWPYLKGDKRWIVLWNHDKNVSQEMWQRLFGSKGKIMYSRVFWDVESTRFGMRYDLKEEKQAGP